MPRHLILAELAAGLPDILASPKEERILRAIVVRPAHGERRDVASVGISLAGGVEGDHWARGCWKSVEDGSPHPDVQICIMNARCIQLIAQERSKWPPTATISSLTWTCRPTECRPARGFPLARQ